MQNAASLYQGMKAKTSTPAELTLMLYEGAIKFCNIALGAMEHGDIEKTNVNIIKAQRIILKLRETLDFKYPVAKEFEQVYSYIYANLVQANIKKDTELLSQMLDEIRGMRDTWKEVMRLNRKGI